MGMEGFNKKNVEKDGQVKIPFFDDKERKVNVYVQKHDIDPAIREMKEAQKKKNTEEDLENIYTEFEEEENDFEELLSTEENIKKEELNNQKGIKKKKKVIDLKEVKKRVAFKKQEKRKKEEEDRRKNSPRYPWQDRKDLQ